MEFVSASYTLKLLKVGKNRVHIIVIDCLWACLTLAVFLSTVKCIFKLNINSRNCRTTTYNSLYFRNERLKARSKGCVDTCTKHPWINQSLSQRFRLSISTEEGCQVVYQERINIEILQLQLIQVFQMSRYNYLTEKILPAINDLLFLLALVYVSWKFRKFVAKIINDIKIQKHD